VADLLGRDVELDELDILGGSAAPNEGVITERD
jgi:hypothetical protein